MQQGLEYAATLDIPFVFSSNGDAFLFHDRTGQGKQIESEVRLSDFPSPDKLWQRYRSWKGLVPSQEEVVLQNYHDDAGGKEPRYYQRIAINKTIEAIAKGQDRILLVMATGTGKTYTAFQIIWRLWKAKRKKRILYLADRNALGEDPRGRTQGLVAKIHQTLQPGIAEMFFARVPVLVEGLEDVAYITTQLYLSERWSDFRRLGCQLIPVNGKDKLIQPLAIAVELKVPAFVVFDADGNINGQHRGKHERDNRALMSLLGSTVDPFPAAHVWSQNHAIWQTNLTDTIKGDFGSHYTRITEVVRRDYAQEGGLEKNGLFIAQWISAANSESVSSPILARLCESILTFASAVS